MNPSDSPRHQNPRDRVQVQPHTDNEALCDFLEASFSQEVFPDRITVQTVAGVGCKQRGTALKTYPYKPNVPKPTRENLVALSNEISALAQNDCEGIGKPQRYGVHVWNAAQSEAPVSRLLLPKRPKGLIDADGDSISFEEEGGHDKHVHDAFKQVHEHNRFMIEQFHESLGALVDRFTSRMDTIEDRNEKLTEKNFTLIERLEDFVSKDHVRKMDMAMQELKVSAIKEGIDTVKSLLPVLINQATGKQTIPTSETTESIAVKNFLSSLTNEQTLELFGWSNEKSEFVQAGIFDSDQTTLFTSISKCEVSGDNIDNLVASFRPDQIGRAQAILRASQYIPLFAITTERQKRKDAAAAAAAIPATTNATTEPQKP